MEKIVKELILSKRWHLSESVIWGHNFEFLSQMMGLWRSHKIQKMLYLVIKCIKLYKQWKPGIFRISEHSQTKKFRKNNFLVENFRKNLSNLSYQILLLIVKQNLL